MARGRIKRKTHYRIRRTVADAIFVAPSRQRAVGKDQRFDLIVCHPLLQVSPDIAASIIRSSIADTLAALTLTGFGEK
ncbi:hypothetical protein [Sphingobium yanoikuyae]|jgi:hypothetical protein|uniref:hypothetical protein n=1 Tax=Sphingobium yanoikuyae TaxID=13690 RepID=UPI0035C7C84D